MWSTTAMRSDDAGVQEALQFLNRFAETMPCGSNIYLPGVERVQVLHRGQGSWVSLLFYGYADAEALALARRLLLPDPAAAFPFEANVAFEGVPATEHGPPAAVAALRPTPSPRPDLAGAADITEQD